MISDQRAEEAFERLRDSVAEVGRAKGELEKSKILAKRTRKKVFLTASGSVAEREAVAESATEVESVDERYITAVVEFETITAMRELESTVLDVWRTECANRRRA